MPTPLTQPVPKGYCRFCPAFGKKPANTFTVKEAPGGYSVRYCTQCGVGLHVVEEVNGFAIGKWVMKSNNAIAQIVPIHKGV